MDLLELYELRNVVKHVPHLIVDPYCIDYDRREQDHDILLQLCIKYGVKTLEILSRNERQNFELGNFELGKFAQSFGESTNNLFVHSIRCVMFNVPDDRCLVLYKVVLKYSSPRHIQIRCNSVLSFNFLSQKLYRIVFNEICTSNLHVRSITPRPPGKLGFNKIIDRNRNIFEKKQEATTILLGISQFRKLPTALTLLKLSKL
jgi:hypothetical protein